MSRVGRLPRINPFSTRFTQPGAIPFRFPTPDGLAASMRRLEETGGWGQIIGPHGSGKSTLLAALLRQFTSPREGEVAAQPRVGGEAEQTPHPNPPPHGGGEQRAWQPRLLRLNTTSRTLPAWVWDTPDRPSLLVIDGFEQLGLLSRLRVVRHCRRTGTGLLITAHRSVGLPTLYRTDVTAETASAIIADLVPPGGEWVLDGFDIAGRLRYHRGSLREVLFELYDRWQAGRG